MTDTKRNSLEEVPPQVPTHDTEASRPISRSKTVRNLNSAGSKMRGLFKTNKKDTKKSEDSARPPLFSSASYGGPSTEPYQKREMTNEPTHEEVIKPILSSEDNDFTPQQQTQQASLQHELDQLNELIQQRTTEVQNEKRNKDRLQADLAEATRIFKERETEYAAIEHSFFEHTRAIRATDDDLSTIRDSFKLLKYSIARLIMTLNKKADKAKAATKFCQTWPHLPILDPTTQELEPSLINVLAEKLVHEHLVKCVFTCPIYPGLKVNDAYFALFDWLQQHQSQFSVRLRQQMAAVVAKSRPESEIQQAAAKEKQLVAQKIYDDLAEIYHPFLRENDAAVDEEKRYYAKICDIVDKALKLTIAIRGQEVEIKTVTIEENNKQPFEEETMTEVKGRNQGLVRFCICPTFMGGDREHGFLEKGKVVISG
ncbi:uncharacterized protein B0P05DRAFT_531550 [Gilbertella persicaria]|uniref:uncharacterized protein n=1 Tax=Gilbertella persicaria TaxID=101096 RepID=UPI00221F6284|nr:uncharacterized protein B0P05DRAFT_531550 [Gilbertella persicaria]KAI8087590.1 hypothetical protein B0P05DRAFT_531550 [Gilbertella persicaria]